jgi:hypothetical protein
MLVGALVLGLPAFPVLGDSHALLPSGIEAFGPLLSCSSTKTKRLVQLFGNLLHVLLIVILCNLDISWGCCRLQRVGWNIVLVVGEEGKWEGGSQG